MNEILDIEKLAELKNKGIISEVEFARQKHVLFNKAIRKTDENYKAKNGIIYILLAWFLGVTGIHNFYARYFWRGGIQLFLSLTSFLFMYLTLIAVAFWALLELLMVNKDAAGVKFKGNKKVIILLRIAAVAWLVIAYIFSDTII